MIGLLITGAYILKGIRKVLHGPLNEAWTGPCPGDQPARDHRYRPADGADAGRSASGRAWIVSVINATVVRLFG